MDKLQALLNWWSDNGLPVPLIRHNGRGDLVATLALLGFGVLAVILLVGGSSVTLAPNALIAGGTVEIPRLDSIGAGLAALTPAIGGLIAYIVKRKHDLLDESGELSGPAPTPPQP